MSANAYAVAARLRKVHAMRDFIERAARADGFDPLDKAVAAGIVEQLEKATDKSWNRLEAGAGQKSFSALSRLMLVNIFRERAGLPALAAGSLGGPARDAGSGASPQEGKQSGAASSAPGESGAAPDSRPPCETCNKPVDYQWFSRTCVSCDAKEIAEAMSAESMAEQASVGDETEKAARQRRRRF